jgi:hypothetical protein
MTRTQVIRVAVAVTSAAFFAQGAGARGEPKNEPPFTRQMHAPRAVETAQRVEPDVRGEPKNQVPFTRRVRR